MVKRNDSINKDRKFKDLHVGDRIFIRNNLHTNKFVKKYTGPFRIERIIGTTVYCFSLASGKSKQVCMSKCRYIGDLKEEEAPESLLAYPETEPLTDDENSRETQIDNPNPAPVLPTVPTVVSQDFRLSQQPTQHKVITIAPNRARYNLRHRN